jgi:hypothetical protein
MRPALRCVQDSPAPRVVSGGIRNAKQEAAHFRYRRKSAIILPKQGFLARTKKRDEEIYSLNFWWKGFSFFFEWGKMVLLPEHRFRA